MAYLLALTFLLTPAYALRFSLFGFSTNLLMMWVVLVWIIFIFLITTKRQCTEFFSFVKNFDKKIIILTGLFFLAGLISLFVKSFDRAKLGQFIVLFLQPISIFFIAEFAIKQHPKTRLYFINSTYLLLAAMGLYAIIQYFTLLGLPPAWWGNSEEPKRALSFFVHPNFYALFSAPLLAFLLPDLFLNLKSKILNLKTVLWLVGAAGLFLSLSRAAWLGLAMTILIYLIFAADKKIRKLFFGGAIVIALVVVAVPNLRYRLILPFYGEKSAVSRLSLWQTGWKGIKESPITGLGLTGFSQQWATLNTDPGLTDTHNFPHNIFLDLWVETGLLGLISMTLLIGLYLYRGIKNRQNIITLSISLFLIALLVQGQIDNPYFKNDLAMVFWIILSLV